MNNNDARISDILNTAGDVVRHIANPWVGLLWLTVMPLRLLEVHFFKQLFFLNRNARSYGNYLAEIVIFILIALILSTAGRTVFVKACAMGLRTKNTSGIKHVLPSASQLLACIYLTVLINIVFIPPMFFLFGWLCGTGSTAEKVFAVLFAAILIFCAAILGGLSATTFENNRQPGVIKPLKNLFSSITGIRQLAGITFIIMLAWCCVFVNLFFVFKIILWAMQSVPGVDLAIYVRLFDLGDNVHFKLLLTAGALAAIEPFWLASFAVYVFKITSKETGEDMSFWFDKIRLRHKSSLRTMLTENQPSPKQAEP